MTQNQRVLDHMITHGYITPLIAFSYGITRLAARIQELEAEGVHIESKIETNDLGVRFARYTLTYRGFERQRRINGFKWRTTSQPGSDHQPQQAAA